MNVNSWKDLESHFSVEMKEQWFSLYPKKEYIERIVKKVFYYYCDLPTKPKSRERWKAAVESFLEKNWKPEAYQPAGTKPKGYAYKPLPMQPECSFCDGLQVIFVTATDDSFKTLMHCHCKNMTDKDRYMLPQWERQYEQIMTREKCPLEWFKPIAFNGSLDPIFDKAKRWRIRVTEAEAFWESERKKLHEDETVQPLDTTATSGPIEMIPECPF